MAAALALGQGPALAADYRDDIGHTALAAELGAAMPQGATVPVAQIEGAVEIGPDLAWMPDLGNAEFLGKTITDRSGGQPNLYSGHATGVAKNYYGTLSSSAPAVGTIDVYEVNSWIGSAFLKTPVSGAGSQPASSDARVANHSWVGTTNNPATSTTYDPAILRRLDWVISRDELTTVVGLANGGSNPALLASSFNAIAVGRTDAGHATGTPAVGMTTIDTFYVAGRSKPDLVAPAVSTSLATPIVSAAAALLIETGHANAALSTDPVSQSSTSRSGALIRNAERAEVVKAALMAGALRTTSGNVAAPDIADYRATPANQTANGLDRRYGAGQLNIANSYRIIAAGEKNSLQDQAAAGGQAGVRGFDYDPRFGGASSTNDVGTYNLPVQSTDKQFSFALVWSLRIHGGSVNYFNSTTTFYNLDANLYDVTTPGSPVLVASSTSASDNTENIHVVLTAGRSYAVQVVRPPSQATFDWRYAAAWQITDLAAPDTDDDGVADALDNCPLTANPGQADLDLDGVGNDCDNCTEVANPDQYDGNGDGYGNLCDGDLNNNGATNSQDTTLFRAALGTSDPSADLNNNGYVNSQDYVIFRALLGYPPGPSGLVP